MFSINKTVCIFFFLQIIFCSISLAEDVDKEQLLKESAAELTTFTGMISKVKQEKDSAKALEKKALAKQLRLIQETYRGLLWGFVDNLDGKKSKHAEFASSLLLTEAKVIKKDIESTSKTVAALEDDISAVWGNYWKSGRDKLAALQKKLRKKRKLQEQLYSDLIKNADKLGQLGGDSAKEVAFAKPLITKQANMLAGSIGLEKDKLALLEKNLSGVPTDSSTGKKLLTDIRMQNIRIRDNARRLQSMALLLEKVNEDASIYKKSVVQSSGNLGSGLFNRKVLSHLITEWWLETKKWFTKRAPEYLGHVISFIVILLLTFAVAFLVKKMIRKLFKTTFPEMSELAKNFVISMSSKLVILVGILLALSNMGIQIGPLLAGLGIMGFVIGFALQDTLSNFASGMMILIYRPYDVGDKIKSAGVKGKVSKMNLVSTTIFTQENHQLTVPNKKIWGDIIHNVTSQPQQRIDLYFKVPFNADTEQVKGIIEEEVKSCAHVIQSKEKSVRVHELGEIDVKYLARFWVVTDDLNEAQWAISEGVKQRFDKAGISLMIIEAAKA